MFLVVMFLVKILMFYFVFLCRDECIGSKVWKFIESVGFNCDIRFREELDFFEKV